MNICKFINSMDIRDYLNRISYSFTTKEAAWFIYQSRNHTVNEKLSAWKELIEYMPDCEIEESYGRPYIPSLHEYLKKYIDHNECIIREFYENTDSVYVISRMHDGSLSKDDVIVIKDPLQMETVAKEVEGQIILNGDDVRGALLRVEKRMVQDPGYLYSFVFDFSLKGELMWMEHLVFDERNEEGFIDIFEDLCFAFPLPFKRGDIVYVPYDGNPFVLDEQFHEIFREKAEVKVRYGDTTDMNVTGYFIDDNGRICHEVYVGTREYTYMGLEYYRENLKGKYRKLVPIKSYLKGDIDLCLLLQSYQNIGAKMLYEESIPSGYTDEGLKLSGVEL